MWSNKFAVTVLTSTPREYKKAQQLTDRVPIKEILREPPKSRLRSRRPFCDRGWMNREPGQDIWEQSWIEGVPPGHDLVTNPTCPQPGFILPRRQFVTLNRMRCGQARCTESLHRSQHMLAPAERDHEAHCWIVPTHCIPWRPATSTRSGSRRSGMLEIVRFLELVTKWRYIYIHMAYAYVSHSRVQYAFRGKLGDARRTPHQCYVTNMICSRYCPRKHNR